MNLMEKYLSKVKEKSVEDTMLLQYKYFIRWLRQYEITADDVKEQHPELLRDIHEAIDMLDSCFDKEDLPGLKDNIEKTKELCRKAVKDINGCIFN